VINVSRDNEKPGILLLEPAVPLSVNFNGITAVFNQVALYTPAPTSIEHINADAVIECKSDQLRLFIPLKSSDTGEHLGFLTEIAAVLDPETAKGLGIVDPKTGKYKTAVAPTGQDWSIAGLVDGARDPYFTWVNGKLTQYTISDSECELHLGWKSSTGATMVYFQNSINVSSTDIAKIRNTIGTLSPKDAGLTINSTLYYPGQSNCPAPRPKLKLPTFNPNSAWADYAVYFGILLIAFLAVVTAVSLLLMENGPVQFFARAISNTFGGYKKLTPPSPAAAPAESSLPSLPAGLPTSLAGLKGLSSKMNLGLRK
jgi:hypothetical protein